jgi:serine carboxypeptidase 1
MKLVCVLLLLCLQIGFIRCQFTLPDEDWGYFDVSEDAHLFYWLYGSTKGDPQDRSQLPLVIWTNGGPGGSSANGDYMEIGPLDVELNPRNYTWVQEVNLLFMDQPVGTGYSYVDNDGAFVTTKEQINEHLLMLFKHLVNKYPAMRQTPVYLFGQSYGGKVVADFGVRLYQAIQAGEINMNFKGIAMGDPWIHPIAMVSSYGKWLLTLSLLDAKDVAEVDAMAAEMARLLSIGENRKATELWGTQQGRIVQMTGGVDFYDYTKNSQPPDPRLDNLMKSEEIRNKYGIPDNVIWSSQRDTVFDKLEEEFMVDCLDSIDYLLNTSSIEVNVYEGSFDLIVDTPGIKWAISQLTWNGLDGWNLSGKINSRINGVIKGNSKCYENFCSYYLLNSGHSAPAQSPDFGLEMLRMIVSGSTKN